MAGGQFVGRANLQEFQIMCYPQQQEQLHSYDDEDDAKLLMTTMQAEKQQQLLYSHDDKADAKDNNASREVATTTLDSTAMMMNDKNCKQKRILTKVREHAWRN